MCLFIFMQLKWKRSEEDVEFCKDFFVLSAVDSSQLEGNLSPQPRILWFLFVTNKNNKYCILHKYSG